MTDVNKISREELFLLHSHYESIVRQELEFFFKYLNFYIGLLSALLAATLTGLLSLKGPSILGLVLLVGPFLTVSLSQIGYKTITVYYRRYSDAWITVINLKRMLGFQEPIGHSTSVLPPVYASKRGGFIAEFRRPPIQALFDQMEKEGATTEAVLEKLIVIGDTLKFARRTFRIFRFATFVVALVIVFFSLR